MRLLLDTHIAIWWLTAPERISATVRHRVQSEADAVYISRASLWEMAVKINIGKLRIDLPLFCHAVVDSGFEWLDIREAHLLKLAQLPLREDHKDPFDRLLIAQCLSEPLFLLTADRALGAYGDGVISDA